MPAIFQFQDTAQFLFVADHFNQYQFSSEIYQLVDYGNVKAPIYTLGMALIYFPFYILAHLIALLWPGIPADGLSLPYQWSVIVASWTYAGIGIYYARKLLILLKVKDWVISLALVGVFFGINYFHYAAYENGMPHSYLLSLYIILCYLTIKWHAEPKRKTAIIIGLIMGLMFLIRPSELVAIFIPILYGIYNGLTLMIKIQKLKNYFSHVVLAICMGLGVVSLQLFYWKINLGVWVFNGYAGHHFDFFNPHILEGLFSYRKGWLLYTPMALFGLLGIFVVWQKDKRWFWPILVYTVLNIYWVLSWHIWWYASSFGMRALIQSFGILLIPFAFLIERVVDKGALLKGFMVGLIVVLTGFNQFQDWQYRNKILLEDEMTSSYYWNVFGKTKYDVSDRKYIDLDEKFTGNKRSYETITEYEPSRGVDTILPDKFGYTYRLNLSNNNILAEDWLSAQIEVGQSSDNFGKWNQARLIQVVKNGDEANKWRGLRFQYLLNQKEITPIEMDYQIPENIAVEDIYECTIWNAGPDTIYLIRFAVNKIIE